MIEAAKIIQPDSTHVKPISRTKEYRCWIGLRERCFRKSNISFKNYGGRGITVCERWAGSKCFKNFLIDVGLKPSKNHSIDRVENNLHYSCGKCDQCLKMGWKLNVRWALNEVQYFNKRSNAIVIYNGKSLTKTEWGKQMGLNRAAIWARFKNMEKAKAINQPIRKAWKLKFKGMIRTVEEWGKLLGLKTGTIYWRLKQGQSIEVALRKAGKTPKKFKFNPAPTSQIQNYHQFVRRSSKSLTSTST